MPAMSRDRKDVIQVRRWGNSLALRIPAGLARSLSIEDGTDVMVQVVDGQMVVEPRRVKVPDLATLVKRTKLANRPTLDESGPAGKELL